jgi:hypothetical protein
MVGPVQSSWHLIPKWLLASRARVLCPKSDSIIPCASEILAGIPVLFISLIARSLYVLIYSSADNPEFEVETTGLYALHENKPNIKIS